MGREHLIKTITQSRRVSAKVMKQYIQVLQKIQLQTTKKEGRARFFFGFNTQNSHWFTCTHCSSVFQQVQMLS